MLTKKEAKELARLRRIPPENRTRTDLERLLDLVRKDTPFNAIASKPKKA